MADQTAFEILQSQLGVLAAPIRDYVEAVIKEQTPPVEEPTPEEPGEETPPEETPNPEDPPVDPEPEPEEPTPVVPEMPSMPDTTTVYHIIDYTDGDFEHGINTKLNAVLIRDNNYVQAGHNLRFKNSQGSNITSTEQHQFGMLVKVNAVTLVPVSHGAPGAVTLYNKYGKPIDPIVLDPVEETPEPEPEPEEPTPTEPVSKYIPMGVNGHEGIEAAYPSAEMESRIKLLADNNIKSYRVDMRMIENTAEVNRLIDLCSKYGVTLRPMLYPTTEDKAYIYAKLFGDRVKVWEIGNEQNLAGKTGAEARIDALVTTYKGMKRASDELNLNLKFTINVTSCNSDAVGGRCEGDASGDTWFLEMARSRGFLFDYISFHHYPYLGDKGYWMDLYLNQMKGFAEKYKTKIFYNELNAAEIYKGATGVEATTVDSLRQILTTLNESYKDVVAEINIYEFLDEPQHSVEHEKHFGLRFDLKRPKPVWDVVKEFAESTFVEPPIEEEPEPEEPEPENPEQPLAELQVVNLEGNADWVNGVYKTNTMILLPIAEKDLIVQGAVIELADGRRGTVNYVSKNTAGKRQSVKTELTGLDPAVVGYPHTVKVISSPIAEEPAPLPFEILPPGSLKKEGMAVLGYNDGQSGGGDVLRQTKMDYGWSNEEYVKKVAADKVTRVRNSLTWERIMPELFGEIDPKYGNEFLNQLKLYGKYGISVSVCMAHNYAGYSFTNTKTTRVQLGTEEVPQGALAHLARKFIEFVNSDPEARKHLFEIELLNEPINLPTPQLVFDEYQLCINAIREVDQDIWIGVDAYPWATTRDFKVYSLPLFDLKDPANKIRIHTHCYFDKGNGGSYTSPDSLINPEEVVKILDGVIDECQKRGWPHVFSEMGAPAAVWVRTSETDPTQGYASPTPNALKALNLALQKALYRGSDVFIWWSSPFQANNWDNVLSIYAPRNADMRRVLLQYL